MPRQRASPQAQRPELVALLRACRSEPEDDTPRLVLADWLDEAGEADRAELIRLQCRLARDENDPDRLALQARERELLSAGMADWLAPFKRTDWYPQFRRGLVRLTTPGTKTSVKALVALARTEASAWIEHLRIGGVTPLAIAELAKSPIAADVRELSAGDTGADEVARIVASTAAFGGLTRLALGRSFTLAGAEAIADAEHLAGVTELVLRDSQMGEQGLRLLLDANNLSGVEVLSLYGCELGPAAPRALAETFGMPRLRSIDLSNNEIGPEGATALAGCTRKSLCELDLYRNAMGDDGLCTLAGTTTLSGVCAVNLGGNQFTDIGMRALADSAFLDRLTSLKFDGPGFTLRGLEALVNSPRAAALERLQIACTHLRDPVGRVLAASPYLGSLRQLSLESNTLGPVGVRALLEAPWLPRLEILELQINQFGDEGAKALATTPALVGCRDLSIWGGMKIGPAGAIALASSPYLSGLHRLQLSCHPIGDEGALAILDSPHLKGLRMLDYTDDGLSPDVLTKLRIRFPR